MNVSPNILLLQWNHGTFYIFGYIDGPKPINIRIPSKVGYDLGFEYMGIIWMVREAHEGKLYSIPCQGMYY